MRFLKGLIILASLLAAFSSSGQQALVTILDGKSGKAIEFAHVSFEAIEGEEVFKAVSDKNGQVKNPVKTNSKIGVSFIGFHTHFGKIGPGESLSIRLVPSILNIDQVVVTAQFTPERVDQSIYKVNVINSAQIENKAASNLGDLLDSELNIRVSQDGVLGTGMSLNGLSGEHIKFLVDGVPVIGRLNGAIDISQLNLYNIDHIEFLDGPMSVVYGSNAMAGVVNLITRENKNYKSYTNLHTYAESVGTYDFDLNTSLRYADHIFQLSGGRNFFAGYSEDKDSRNKTWKPKRAYFFDGSYILLKEKLSLRYSPSYYNELLLDKGSPLSPYFERAFDTYFNTVRFSNKMDLSLKLKANRFLNVLAAYSVFDRKRENYNIDLTTLKKNLRDADTTKFHSWLLRSTFSKDNKEDWFNYQLGIDLNLDRGSGDKIEGKEKEIGDYAAFLSVRLDPLKKLELQPGVRLIYNTNYNAPLVYSLNAKYNFGKRLALRASFARGFRAPSLKELYLDFVDVNHKIYGNPDLKAERSYNYNASLLYHADRKKHVYEAELSWFYNQIENSIDLVARQSGVDFNPADGPPPYTYLNLENYGTTGIKLNLNYRFYPNFNVKTGLNQTKTMISQGTGNNEQTANSTDYNFSVNYKWIKHDLNFSVFYKYNGKLPNFSVNEDDEVSLAYIQDFHNLDLTIGKSFLDNNLYITFGAKNIFNNKDIPISGNASGGIHSGGVESSLVGYGRTYFVGASYNIKYLR
jgi:outer membrane receptor for ferrienterochelin and colicins